jgi:hypothetical protein
MNGSKYFIKADLNATLIKDGQVEEEAFRASVSEYSWIAYVTDFIAHRNMADVQI